mmetsp:Transcript_24263/g.47522  ORF Transcript_24263/g.47522 Transcript_24263/m.47522 type:complete len:223 (+) Transcript_24263:376-1044(+)
MSSFGGIILRRFLETMIAVSRTSETPQPCFADSSTIGILDPICLKKDSIQSKYSSVSSEATSILFTATTKLFPCFKMSFMIWISRAENMFKPSTTTMTTSALKIALRVRSKLKLSRSSSVSIDSELSSFESFVFFPSSSSSPSSWRRFNSLSRLLSIAALRPLVSFRFLSFFVGPPGIPLSLMGLICDDDELAFARAADAVSKLIFEETPAVSTTLTSVPLY